MIDDANKNELIEQYLQGKLSGNLLAEFKNKLATDADFRTEVALEKAIIRNLKTVGRTQMQLKFESFHQELAQKTYEYAPAKHEPSLLDKLKEFIAEKLPMLTARPYLVMAVASVALIIAFSLTLDLFSNRSTSSEIYQVYYSPYPIETYRGAPTATALEIEATAAYNAGDYPRSITLFKQILENKADERILFYLGNAYLSANRPQEASSIYQTYLQKYQDYENEAKWYLGLSYIKTSKDNEAKKLFEELAANQNPENDYQDKAKEILKKYKFKGSAK